MSNQLYRGRIKGGSVVLLDEPAPLPDGTCVIVTVDEEDAQRSQAVVSWDAAQTPEAFQAAIAGGPQVAEEDVDEWERVIAKGKRPRSRVDLLGDSQTP